MSIVEITPEHQVEDAERDDRPDPDRIRVIEDEPGPGPAVADEPAADSGESSPPPEPATSRPLFTITEAATACAVSRKTITRKLADLSEHGAAKDEDGVWRIPVEALLAVGLHPGRSLPGPSPARMPRPIDSPPPAASAASPATAVPRPSSTAGPGSGPDLVTVPRERWDDLRLRLARAEAEAAERGLALADARLALRALTAAPAPEAARPVIAAPPPQPLGWLMGPVVTPAPGTGHGAETGPDVPGSVTQDMTQAGPPPRKRRWWRSVR